MPSAAPRRPAAAQAQRFGPRRTRALRRRLLAWWDAGHRKLPWRYPQRAADPYRVWLAEVMLQQTRVSVVIPYYERFVARYPTLEALAAAREDDVLALWGGLGYYARGRNLAAAAREAVARYGGLPASVERLRTLPGFGPYTAGAVASIAFAIPAPAVDGNAARVLARLAAVQGATSDAAFRTRVDALAAELVDPDRPGDLNQALMELGATACAPRGPSCRRCPVAALCAARAAGTAAEIPAPRRRPARPAMELACAVARRNGSILLARRPARGLFAGLWTPPSAELGPGDDPRAALSRAAGRRLAVGEELATCERILTHRALTLRAFACEVRGPIAVGAGLRWVPMDELESVGMPSAFRALLARV